MKKVTKKDIVESIKKHFDGAGLEAFTLLMSLQEKVLIPVFMDIVGYSEQEYETQQELWNQTNEFYINDKQRNAQLKQYLKLIDEIRLETIQEHPELSMSNITKEEVEMHIQRELFIDEPETLFYNTQINIEGINIIAKAFSGHHFDPRGILVAHIAGHPTVEINYPTMSLDQLESVDSFVELMQKAIRQTDKNLSQNRDKLIELAQVKQNRGQRDIER